MSGGRLCSQSDAAADKTVQSDSFFEYLKTTDALLDGYRRNADKRVKIAIIDSGVDTQHPHVQELRSEARNWPRLTTASFLSSVPDGEDHVGHGTHITVTVMRIAKWAEIYVATVVDAQGVVNIQSVAKALMHSILEWKVDVISLSLGFDRGHSRIDTALREADRRDILVFAAVSNYGAAALRRIAWPASMTKVFGINSANFYGVTSSFNPPENDNDTFSRYKLLGEGVRSAWPLHKGEGDEKILSGTSMAAPIAGAIASLFIEFMRQNSEDEEAAADAKIMETPDGMREIFHSIGNVKSRGDFFKYVTPWHLLHSDGDASVNIDRRHTLGRIREVLRGLRIENSEIHDTSTDDLGESGALFANETTQNAAYSDSDTTNPENKPRLPVTSKGHTSLRPISLPSQKKKSISGAALLKAYGNMRYLCYIFAGALDLKRKQDFDIARSDQQQRYNLALEEGGALANIGSTYKRASEARYWVNLSNGHLTLTAPERKKEEERRRHYVPGHLVAKPSRKGRAKVDAYRRKMARYSLYEDVRLNFEAHLPGEGIVSVFGFHVGIRITAQAQKEFLELLAAQKDMFIEIFQVIDLSLIHYLLNETSTASFHRLNLEDEDFADLPSFERMPEIDLDTFRFYFSPIAISPL